MKMFIFSTTLLAILLLACCPASAPAQPPDVEGSPPATFPAASPTPDVLTVAAIEAEKKKLTDLQWETYRQELVGQLVRFGGEVIEVYDDGRVQIRDGKGILTVTILYEIPLDVAAALSKDQMVRGAGRVREVDTTLGLAVWIDVEAME